MTLARQALAVYRHALKHGAWPETLEPFAWGALPDPFTGEALRSLNRSESPFPRSWEAPRRGEEQLCFRRPQSPSAAD